MKNKELIWFIAIFKVNGDSHHIGTRHPIQAINKFGAYRKALQYQKLANERGANFKLVKVEDSPHLNN